LSKFDIPWPAFCAAYPERYEQENIGLEGAMLKANKTAALEDTLGTGLATLLAKNQRLIDIELPEKSYRLDSDSGNVRCILKKYCNFILLDVYSL
jgi:hypothetical protein